MAPESNGAQQQREEEQLPAFLGLSAELRNRIYEDALIEEDEIQITADLRPPGLLSVCSQIRRETRSMWLVQNRFWTEIRDCDTNLMSAWMNHTGDVEEHESDVQLEGSCHWGNLMVWCKRCYESDEFFALVDKQDGHKEWRVISAATRMAAFVSYQTWEECLKALDMLRQLAGLLDPDWLEDLSEEN